MIASSREKCRSCGAPIVWVKHQTTGRAAPINVDPDPEGNIVITDDMFGNPTYIIVTKSEPGTRYTSHFATCQNVKVWRKQPRHDP